MYTCENDLVSVIVPVYNVEKYLPPCIESIIKQSYSNIEIILVDDGSTDSSGDICDRYANIDKRIQVFHTYNHGVSSARNMALDHMRGKYCILVDSDDLIHSELIERSLKILKECDLDAVVYSYRTFSDGETIAEFDVLEESDVEIFSNKDVMKIILEGKKFRMLACNKLYRADLWKNVRFPLERKYGDDTAVTYKLMDRCNAVGYIKDELYFYRMREGSALHSEITQDNLQLFLSYLELIEYYKQNHLELYEWVLYAYAIRLFDFWATVKQRKMDSGKALALLKVLKEISFRYLGLMTKNKYITLKQRLLIKIFMISPKWFWFIYN